jgi:excisionase family DNA binding protein
MGVERMSQLNLSVSAQEKLLTPSEVATLFRVDPKTVTRWAKAGKLTSIKTLGGHRRYRESEVKALLKSTLGDSVSNSSIKQKSENRL